MTVQENEMAEILKKLNSGTLNSEDFKKINGTQNMSVSAEIENEVQMEALFSEPQEEALLENVKIGERLNVKDIHIPAQMENNISMGHEKLDTLMSGDGVTPSTACLVTGIPGSGKSTLLLQLADCIMKTGNIALYNSCEESLVQVSRVAKRLKLQYGFYPSAHRSVFELIEHANIIREENPTKQVFLFVDSLQTIEVPNFEYDEKTLSLIKDSNGKPIPRKGRPMGNSSAQVEATKILTQWCKKTYGVVFLIGQVNKDGDFAGRQAIKHWVDAHMHLDFNRHRNTADYGARIVEMQKNRFGIAGVFYAFEIEARGIRFLEPKAKP